MKPKPETKPDTEWGNEAGPEPETEPEPESESQPEPELESESQPEPEPEPETEPEPEPDVLENSKDGFFSIFSKKKTDKLDKTLDKTREGFFGKMKLFFYFSKRFSSRNFIKSLVVIFVTFR